jgi:hypothetical protein
VEHHLQEGYAKRVRAFETANPKAHRFLMHLERDGSAHGVQLVAATKIQLYKDNAFIALMQLSTLRLKPFSLLLSAPADQLIAAHASDASHLFVPRPLERLIMAHSGFSKGWAAARNNVVELKLATPDAFYDVLLNTIFTLKVNPSQ